MPSNCALPRGSGGPFESISLDSLISKRQVQGMTKKATGSSAETSKYIWPRTLCWHSRHAIYAVTNDPTPITLMHPCSMATILLILHLSILFLGSGINRKSSIKLTLVAAAKEGQNNKNKNNKNPVLLILHLSIFLSGSGINRKSSIKLTLVAAAEEEKNNNNNNNPV